MTLRPSILLVICALLTAHEAQAQIYRYEDADGNVVFTDQPQLLPDKQRKELQEKALPQERRRPAAEGRSLGSLKEQLREAEWQGQRERVVELLGEIARESERQGRLADAARAYGRLAAATRGEDELRHRMYVRRRATVLRALGQAERAEELEGRLDEDPDAGKPGRQEELEAEEAEEEEEEEADDEEAEERDEPSWRPTRRRGSVENSLGGSLGVQPRVSR